MKGYDCIPPEHGGDNPELGNTGRKKPMETLTAKREKKITEIKKYGKTNVKGYAEAVSCYSGKKVSAHQAIKAHCYDCLGYYADGVDDCKNDMCALYSFMPYSPKVKDPKRVEIARKRATATGFGKRPTPV